MRMEFNWMSVRPLFFLTAGLALLSLPFVFIIGIDKFWPEAFHYTRLVVDHSEATVPTGPTVKGCNSVMDLSERNILHEADFAKLQTDSHITPSGLPERLVADVSAVDGPFGTALKAVSGTNVFDETLLPVSMDNTYCLRARFQVNKLGEATNEGVRTFIGVETFDRDKNSLATNSFRYMATYEYFPADGQIVEVSGSITGIGEGHQTFREGTAFVRPVMLLNFGAYNAETVVHSMTFEKLPDR